MNLKKKVTQNILNIPGWHTKRKILVIESDDWGSIRMPSKDVYTKFLDKGIHVDHDPFCRYDSIASNQDLEALFEVLNSVKDYRGNRPIITANTIMANPDFTKIKDSDFNSYHYEIFSETIKRYNPNQNTLELWHQGINEKIFYPQFHGREHLNISKWLRDLRNDAPLVRIAFDSGIFGLNETVDSKIKGTYMGAFDSCLASDLSFYKDSINDGLKLFENIFGYRSLSFTPTRYTWSPKIEPYLIENGVKYLQGMVTQVVPVDEGNSFEYKRNFQGLKSDFGLIYLIRNCFFEPSLNRNFDWVGDCLNRIKIAYFWNKPVTISSHRLNFIGRLDENNRTNNLSKLKLLLQLVIKKYPDVEFMNSVELGKIIQNENELS